MRSRSENSPRQFVQSRDTVLNFGKHKGHTVQIILDENPGYILWLQSERIVDFSVDIYDEALRLDAEQDYYPYPDDWSIWGLDISD